MQDFLDTVSKDFKSALEIPYAGRSIDFELVKDYADGMPHIFSRDQQPLIAEQFVYHQKNLYFLYLRVVTTFWDY